MKMKKITCKSDDEQSSNRVRNLNVENVKKDTQLGVCVCVHAKYRSYLAMGTYKVDSD